MSSKSSSPKLSPNFVSLPSGCNVSNTHELFPLSILLELLRRNDDGRGEEKSSNDESEGCKVLKKAFFNNSDGILPTLIFSFSLFVAFAPASCLHRLRANLLSIKLPSIPPLFNHVPFLVKEQDGRGEEAVSARWVGRQRQICHALSYFGWEENFTAEAERKRRRRTKGMRSSNGA
jgi:hypothetical protein